MKIEMCDQFYYRVQDEDIYNIFNTSKENILRNNKNIKFIDESQYGEAIAAQARLLE